jgi:hypothetical protein
MTRAGPVANACRAAPRTAKPSRNALNPPSWATDWQAAVLALDGRLSPELERLVRTDEVLDAITVMHSLSRLIGRVVGGVRDSIPGSLGLPTARQVAQLQRSIDRMADTATEPPPNRIQLASRDDFR